MAKKAPGGRRLKVHYTGSLEDGTVFDTSRDKEPMIVPLGLQRVITGFEEALEGMGAGETKRVVIPPGKAYGPHRPELVTEVARDQFPDALQLREGQRLQLTNPAGMVTAVLVKALGDDTVTLDANHPLAGHTLVFDIEVLEVL